MLDYKPQPGTIVAKVYEHLKVHPHTEFTSAELAELLDFDRYALPSSLEAVLKRGLVRKGHRPGDKRILLWSLGDGKPLPLPEDYEPDEPLHASTKPAKGAKKLDNNHFRAGLFTDGSLLVEVGGLQFTLTREQVGAVRSLFA